MVKVVSVSFEKNHVSVNTVSLSVKPVIKTPAPTKRLECRVTRAKKLSSLLHFPNTMNTTKDELMWRFIVGGNFSTYFKHHIDLKTRRRE